MLRAGCMTRIGQILLILAVVYPHISLAKDKETNIILIGNQRGMTTVFERYMIKRGDYEIYHEPFSLQAMMDGMRVMSYSRLLCGDNLLLTIHESIRKKPYFIKDMAFFIWNNLDLIQLAKRDDVKIIFLIRRPEQAVLSHYKLSSQSGPQKAAMFGGTTEEMRYEVMEQLFYKIMRVTNKTPILIDADDLVSDPKAVLSKLCATIEIPFREEDLHWESGEKNEWALGADTWHKEVTNSQGFIKKAPAHSLDDVDPKDRRDIEFLIRNNQAVYERLVEYKFKP